MSKQTPHPQRLAPSSPPGSSLKRAFEVARSLKLRAVADHDPVYLAQIRALPCLKCGMDPCGEAAHIRRQSAALGKRGGIGKKPADKWALPLCAGCHRDDDDSQHKIGELAFWTRVGLNPLLICTRLYPKRGDPMAMRAVIFTAIAERESLSQIRGS
jgi:hypothetical protein